jgi:hypothetical protein
MMTFTTRAAGNSVAYNWLAVARHYHGIFDLRKWLPHRSNAQRFIVIHIFEGIFSLAVGTTDCPATSPSRQPRYRASWRAGSRHRRRPCGEDSSLPTTVIPNSRRSTSASTHRPAIDCNAI